MGITAKRVFHALFIVSVADSDYGIVVRLVVIPVVVVVCFVCRL